MVKSELIERIAEKTPHLKESDVLEGVNLILETISRGLESGGRAEIRGFGSFSLSHRKARQGRNPKTGESVTITAKSIPHFKPGVELKERVNSGA